MRSIRSMPSGTPRRGGSGAPGASPAVAGLGLGSALALGGTAGRWGQLDALGLGAGGRSPFPCSRTPQPQSAAGGGGARTPGSALHGSTSHSHRGFMSLLTYNVGGS
ncbi:hypothetical protein HYH03_005405 [Edaphochlamys debaryana]|uniref:Uncharacterized protein n=1 Tax=Edaphochlamys debaryana TaxID=47281 RepID=A0A835Y888_9CHLO|nr:hypothetical protein HYH03_005405 [Edaphochlamys debaryana]|eukprot:KAG2496583.1 hypothetical protein HYH03_005405 [Edaphochlamys debaryana]